MPNNKLQTCAPLYSLTLRLYTASLFQIVINMEEAKLQTLVQIKAFLGGASEVMFRVPKGKGVAGNKD
jgi:hypothetical protein